MKWQSEFVELDKRLHEREVFDSGEMALNEFLKQQAIRHMKAGISRTMVLPATRALDSGRFPICAFYTIAPSSIKRENLPKTQQKKLPHYPVPVFLLAQLAVEKSIQNQGLGSVALVKALEHFLTIHQHMRAYAVVVDALNVNAETFYRKYGFEELCVIGEKKRLFLPMNTLENLFSQPRKRHPLKDTLAA